MSNIERLRPTASERRRRTTVEDVNIETPVDTTFLLQSFDTHVAAKVMKGEERNVLKTFNHYSKVASWKLHDDQSRIKAYVVNSGLDALLRGGHTIVHHRLISAFCERWHPETNTFHMPIGEMTIILDDVASLLHIPVADNSIHLPGVRMPDAIDILQQSLGLDFDTAMEEITSNQGPDVKLSFLREQFMAYDDRCSEQEIERATMAFLLHLLGCTLFADKSGISVPVVYLTLLVDLSTINEFAWGAAALAYLYKHLGLASRFKTKQLAGYMTLLQGWIYEHFPSMSPVPSESYDETLPRVLRRTPRRPTETVQHYRSEIEEITLDQVQWNPYKKHREHQRCPRIAYFRGYLRCGSILEGYMPDRVLRQFRYEQSIPSQPLVSHAHITDDSEIDEQWNNWPQYVLSGAVRGRKCPKTDRSMCAAGYLEWLDAVSVLSFRPKEVRTTADAPADAPAAARPPSHRRPSTFIAPASYDDALSRIQRASEFILGAADGEPQSVYYWNEAAFLCAAILHGTDDAGPSTVPAGPSTAGPWTAGPSTAGPSSSGPSTVSAATSPVPAATSPLQQSTIPSPSPAPQPPRQSTYVPPLPFAERACERIYRRFRFKKKN